MNRNLEEFNKALNKYSIAILYYLKEYNYDYYKELLNIEFLDFSMLENAEDIKDLFYFPVVEDNTVLVNTFATKDNFLIILYAITSGLIDIKLKDISIQENLNHNYKKELELIGFRNDNNGFQADEKIKLLARKIHIEFDNEFESYVKRYINTFYVFQILKYEIMGRIGVILDKKLSKNLKKEIGLDTFRISEEGENPTFCEFQDHDHFAFMYGDDYQKGCMAYFDKGTYEGVYELNIDISYFVDAHRKNHVMYNLFEVVAHELCHIPYMHHKKEFWELMESLGFDINYEIKWPDGHGEWYYHVCPNKELREECDRLITDIQDKSLYKLTPYYKNDNDLDFDLNLHGIENDNYLEEFLEAFELPFH